MPLPLDMESVRSVKWDCVEWAALPDENGSFRVLSIRGDENEVGGDMQNELLRTDLDTGVQYRGKRIARSETHSVFELIENIMTHKDWRLFIGTNG